MGTSLEDLLQARYYQPGEKTWEDLVNRVHSYVFQNRPMDMWTETCYDALLAKAYVPSSPVLMNAGTRYPMMCSCFVLPVEDNIEAIMTGLSNTAYIQKFGGGVGIDFSPIRKEGSRIASTNGTASGPVSFMGLWNEAMEVIKQGGKRQGAMMGVLNVDHPDLSYFLRAKQVEGRLTNFNLSVSLPAHFWHHHETHTRLRNIAEHTWVNGEPGYLFLDNINRFNPYGVPIRATNPCGEVPLPPYGACNLGSINLNSALVYDKQDGFYLSIEQLEKLVQVAIEWLNRVLDTTWWPLEQLEKFQNKHRPLGMGVMGLADVLALQGIPYGTQRGRKYVEDLFGFLYRTASKAAGEWAARWDKNNNAALMSIAPTGTIAMLANASYSIEPYFTFAGTKKVDAGNFSIEQPLVSAVVTDVMHENWTSEDRAIVKETGSVAKTSISENAKKVLQTATEIDWASHVMMQAAIQKYVDHSVSKTINMAYDTSVEDVMAAVEMAHRRGCKGLTIYRTGSRRDEVMTAPDSNECPSGMCEL